MERLLSCDFSNAGSGANAKLVTKIYSDGRIETGEYPYIASLTVSEEGVSLSNVVIGKLHLSGTITGAVELEDCIIGETTRDRGLVFERPVDFAGSTFIGECDLFARFCSRAIFDETVFLDSCDLSGEYQGYTSFERASFFGDTADFQEACFDGANFRGIHAKGCYFNFQETRIVNNDFLFSDCIIENGDVDFAGTVFDHVELISFLGTESNSLIRFNRVSFRCNELRWFRANINKLVFMACDFECTKAEFEMECDTLIMHDGTNLRILDFRKLSDLSALSLCGLANTGIILIDYGPRELIKMIDVDKPTVWVRRNDWRKPNHKDKADQYFLLKQTFNKSGMFDYEDEMYCAYRREMRKHQLDEARVRIRDRENGMLDRIKSVTYLPKHFFFDFFLCDLIGCYSTSPKRVFISCLVTILAFALLFIPFTAPLPPLDLVHDFGGSSLAVANSLSRCLYGSAQAFLTVGFLGSSASGIPQALCALEGFIGVFLITYFTASFAHRVLR